MPCQANARKYPIQLKDSHNGTVETTLMLSKPISHANEDMTSNGISKLIGICHLQNGKKGEVKELMFHKSSFISHIYICSTYSFAFVEHIKNEKRKIRRKKGIFFMTLNVM